MGALGDGLLAFVSLNMVFFSSYSGCCSVVPWSWGFCRIAIILFLVPCVSFPLLSALKIYSMSLISTTVVIILTFFSLYLSSLGSLVLLDFSLISFSYFKRFVYLCLSVCLSCDCVWVGGVRESIGCPLSLSTYLFEAGSLPEPGSVFPC